MPQTVSYERYLLGENGPLAKEDRTRAKEVARQQRHALRTLRGRPDAAVDSVIGAIGLRLGFVDLTRVGIPNGAYDELIGELNAMFDFRGYGVDEFEGISFCVDGIERPRGLLQAEQHRSRTRQRHRRAESQTAYDSLFAGFTQVVERLQRKHRRSGVIPVIVLDGAPDLLGFASDVPHDGPTDVIAVAGDLLRDSIPGRTEGKTVGQLIANFIGLRPIWYAESPYGDMVDDTPCHNGPNHGTFAPGEVHLSTCDGMPVELVDNYMDNTDESIRTSWTPGQIRRLRDMLELDDFRGQYVGEVCDPPRRHVRGRNVDVAPEFGNPPADEIVIELRPNPVGSQLYLTLRGRAAEGLTAPTVIYLTDLAGARMSVPVSIGGPTSYTLDLTGLAAGTYYVTVVTPDGRVHGRSIYKL